MFNSTVFLSVVAWLIPLFLLYDTEWGIRPLLEANIEEVIENPTLGLRANPAGTGTIALLVPDPRRVQKIEDWNDNLLADPTLKYVVPCSYVQLILCFEFLSDL